MMKKILRLLPLLILSCASFDTGKTDGSYHIGDAFDGKDGDFLDKGEVQKFVNGEKIPHTLYESLRCDLTVLDGTVTEIRYDRNDNPISEFWKSRGITWETGYYGCLSSLLDGGYDLKVDYPHYDLPYWKSNAHIYATHSNWPREKYYFHFYGDEMTDEGALSPALSSITVSRNGSNYSYPGRLEYESDGYSLFQDSRVEEAVAFSSLLGELNGAKGNRLDPFPGDRDKGREIMSSSWDIHSREDLLKTLGGLDEKGHSRSLEEVLEFLDDAPEGDLLEYVAQNEKDALKVSRILYVAQIRDMPGLRERTLRAWDWGRSISLCRWGFNAEFLTEEEARERILYYRERILNYYNSWEDYTVGYALGRMFWSAPSGDSDDYLDRANEVFKAYTQLVHREKSYWQHPWNEGGDGEPLFPYNLKVTDIPIDYDATKSLLSWKRYYKGLRLYSIGSYSEGMREFKQSLLLHDGFTPPLRYLMYSEKKLSHIQGALDYAGKLLNLLPGDYFGNLTMGEIYEEGGDFTRSEEQLLKTIGLAEEKSPAYTSLARIYIKQKKYSEAEELFVRYDRKVNEGKVNYYAHLLRAILYYEQEDYSGAADYFFRCYEEYSDNGNVNFMLGRSFLYTDPPRYDAAYLYLDRARSKGVNLPDGIREFLNQYEGENRSRNSDIRT